MGKINSKPKAIIDIPGYPSKKLVNVINQFLIKNIAEIVSSYLFSDQITIASCTTGNGSNYLNLRIKHSFFQTKAKRIPGFLVFNKFYKVISNHVDTFIHPDGVLELATDFDNKLILAWNMPFSDTELLHQQPKL